MVISGCLKLVHICRLHQKERNIFLLQQNTISIYFEMCLRKNLDPPIKTATPTRRQVNISTPEVWLILLFKTCLASERLLVTSPTASLTKCSSLVCVLQAGSCFYTGSCWGCCSAILIDLFVFRRESIAPGSVSTSGGAQTAGPTGDSNRFESKMVHKYKNPQIHNYTVTQIQNTQHSRTGMCADC